MWLPCRIDSPNHRQEAETGLQLRSRIVQVLHVPRVRVGPSLAAALLGGLFESLAGQFPFYLNVQA